MNQMSRIFNKCFLYIPLGAPLVPRQAQVLQEVLEASEAVLRQKEVARSRECGERREQRGEICP